ncbi:hypothetical protein ACNSTU_17400 [Aquisalimonas sp. APHAB1-3]|uniref:hypothetical protein n=1 Tax=Aquisalimonas sp. APHAB1-3 TaxID=3402080 RepID=UPI003AAE945A
MAAEVDELSRAAPNSFFRWLQIKEKFGGLRAYASHDGLQGVEEILRSAHARSARTCQVCGQPGEMRRVGPIIMTVCIPHLLDHLQEEEPHLGPSAAGWLERRQQCLDGAIPADLEGSELTCRRVLSAMVHEFARRSLCTLHPIDLDDVQALRHRPGLSDYVWGMATVSTSASTSAKSLVLVLTDDTPTEARDTLEDIALELHRPNHHLLEHEIRDPATAFDPLLSAHIGRAML